MKPAAHQQNHLTCAGTTSTSASGALLSAVRGEGGHLCDVTGHTDQLVTFLVNEELALGALEALATQAPDAIVAVGTEGSLKRLIRLIKASICYISSARL